MGHGIRRDESGAAKVPAQMDVEGRKIKRKDRKIDG